MVILFYYTSCPFSKQTLKQQQQMEQVLTAKRIKFVKLDTADKQQDYLNVMRAIIGDPKAVAPQICNGNTYCGNYEMLTEANEWGELEQFLKLTPKPILQNRYTDL